MGEFAKCLEDVGSETTNDAVNCPKVLPTWIHGGGELSIKLFYEVGIGE